MANELAFDNSPLSAFGRAGRLNVLETLTSRFSRRVTSQAVLDELAIGASTYPGLEDIPAQQWLQIVHVDSLPMLKVLAWYTQRFGSTERDIGEASVLAWAEVTGAAALVDDATARQVAKERSVRLMGSLGLIADGINARLLTERDAAGLIDDLRSAGARFPCTGGTFLQWAEDRGLLHRISA